MTKIVIKKVFLQYGQVGQKVSGCQIDQSDANKFVALDSGSGGYPYAVDIDQAHNFKSVQKALDYTRGDSLVVREVTITYEF